MSEQRRGAAVLGLLLGLVAWGCAGSGSGQPAPPGAMTFTTEGSSFAPVIVVTGSPQILWTFADGTTSTSPAPAKDYGSAGHRRATLSVTPWSAVTRINLGFDGEDGGDNRPDPIEHVADQQVSAVEGLALVAPTLRQWCSSHNLITALDFGNFTQLDTIEAYQSSTLASVNLENTPRLSRACFEQCGLTALDVSQSPLLADLRGAVNQFPTIKLAASHPDVWHVCTRDNPQLTDQALYADTGRFPAISELWIWNDNQAGTLRIPSSSPTAYVYVAAHANHYTSADLHGALRSTSQDGLVDLAQNALTSVDLTGCVQITQLDLSQNALPQAQVDAVLATLDGFPAHAPAPAALKVDLSGGANAAPSIAGQGHVTSLRDKGWTVTTN